MTQQMLDNIEFTLNPDEVIHDQFVLPSPPVPPNSHLPLTVDQMERPPPKKRRPDFDPTAEAVIPKRRASTPGTFSSNVKKPGDGHHMKSQTPPKEITKESLMKPIHKRLTTLQNGENERVKTPRCAIRFVKDLPEALPPFRSTPRSAGLDISSPIDLVIQPGSIVTIDSGLRFQLPKNTYGKLSSRSSLAAKGLLCLESSISEDYRGRVFLLMMNCHVTESIKICRGDPIAQLITVKISYPKAIQYHDLAPTLRGATIKDKE